MKNQCMEAYLSIDFGIKVTNIANILFFSFTSGEISQLHLCNPNISPIDDVHAFLLVS